MAQTVEDAAILLNVLVGSDEQDPITLLSDTKRAADYTTFLDEKSLQGKRIGVPRIRFYDECPEEVVNQINAALQVMEELGAEIIDPVEIAYAEAEDNIHVMIYEFKPALNAYLQKLASHVPVHTLSELIAYNGAHAEAALKYGQAMLEASDRTQGTLAEAEYIKARLEDIKYARTEGIDRVLDEHQLDAIVFPSSWGAGIAAKAGYPSINVPAGFTSEGEPVGISFTAKAFEEGKLIGLAYSFEQATHFRKPPKF